MTAPTPRGARRACDHGLYGPARCRKAARFAIQHLVPFGHRVTGRGDEPVYMSRMAFRCDSHANVESEQARVTMAEWVARESTAAP